MNACLYWKFFFQNPALENSCFQIYPFLKISGRIYIKNILNLGKKYNFETGNLKPENFEKGISKWEFGIKKIKKCKFSKFYINDSNSPWLLIHPFFMENINFCT